MLNRTGARVHALGLSIKSVVQLLIQPIQHICMSVNKSPSTNGPLHLEWYSFLGPPLRGMSIMAAELAGQLKKNPYGSPTLAMLSRVPQSGRIGCITPAVLTSPMWGENQSGYITPTLHTVSLVLQPSFTSQVAPSTSQKECTWLHASASAEVARQGANLGGIHPHPHASICHSRLCLVFPQNFLIYSH